MCRNRASGYAFEDDPGHLLEAAGLIAPAWLGATFRVLLVDQCEEAGVRAVAAAELPLQAIDVGRQYRDLAAVEHRGQAAIEVLVVVEVAVATVEARPHLGTTADDDARV